MTHIMLDLETMGTGYNAAIVAIGACKFDPHTWGVDEKFYTQVDLQSSVDAGLSIDASTILWWLKQSDEARKSTFEGASVLTLHSALHKFNLWVGDVGAMVWGNGATFDNVVIRSAFKAVSIPPVWSFRNDKCYRTVINLLPEARRPAFEPYGTAHNALDDAIAQALHLQKVYKELKL